MELMVVDGKVVFKERKFGVTLTKKQRERLKRVLLRISVEMNGIFSKNKQETAQIRQVLNQEGISFTEKDISPTQEEIKRAKLISGKNLTRSKALRLLQSDYPAEVLDEIRKIKYSQVDSYIEKLSDLQSFLKKLTKVVLTLVKEMED